MFSIVLFGGWSSDISNDRKGTLSAKLICIIVCSSCAAEDLSEAQSVVNTHWHKSGSDAETYSILCQSFVEAI